MKPREIGYNRNRYNSAAKMLKPKTNQNSKPQKCHSYCSSDTKCEHAWKRIRSGML